MKAVLVVGCLCTLYIVLKSHSLEFLNMYNLVFYFCGIFAIPTKCLDRYFFSRVEVSALSVLFILFILSLSLRFCFWLFAVYFPFFIASTLLSRVGHVLISFETKVTEMILIFYLNLRLVPTNPAYSNNLPFASTITTRLAYSCSSTLISAIFINNLRAKLFVSFV